MKNVPAYMVQEVAALEKALVAVHKHAHKIVEYAAAHGADADDFWYENALDLVYEFNAQTTLQALQDVLDEEW